MDRRDYTAYQLLFASAARDLPESVSEEALDFWAEEVNRARAKGFSGDWDLEYDPRKAQACHAWALLDGRLLAEQIDRTPRVAFGRRVQADANRYQSRHDFGGRSNKREAFLDAG